MTRRTAHFDSEFTSKTLARRCGGVRTTSLETNDRIDPFADQGIFNCPIDVLEGIEGDELFKRKAAELMQFDQFGKKFFRVGIPEDDAPDCSAAIHNARRDESEFGIFRSAPDET